MRNFPGLDVLLSILEEGSSKGRHCHNEAHNLGRVVFEHTGSLFESSEQCGVHCTEGCWHGACLQFLDDVTNEIAARTDKEGGVVAAGEKHETRASLLREYYSSICGLGDTIYSRMYGTGDCYHGLGHAVMVIAKYDIKRAMFECKQMDSQLGSYYCATGAYMEWGIKYNTSMRLNPCDQTNDFPAACYRIILPKLLMNNPNFRFRVPSPFDVVKICLKMHDIRQQRGCFHGVGFTYSQLFVGNNNGKWYIEDVCTNNPRPTPLDSLRLANSSSSSNTSTSNATAPVLALTPPPSPIDFSLSLMCVEAAGGTLNTHA